MKTKITLLSITAFLLIASAGNSLATTTTFYGMNISASLSTQVITGSTYSFTTQHINNHTITNTVFATGTTGAPKASDLAVVYGSIGGLSVINTSSTNNIVAVIAQSGSNSATTGGILSSSKSFLSITAATTDLEFTVPGVSGTQTTIVRVTAKENTVTGALSKALFTFFGGHNFDSPGGTFFQGTLKQTSKVYH